MHPKPNGSLVILLICVSERAHAQALLESSPISNLIARREAEVFLVAREYGEGTITKGAHEQRRDAHKGRRPVGSESHDRCVVVGTACHQVAAACRPESLKQIPFISDNLSETANP